MKIGSTRPWCYCGRRRSQARRRFCERGDTSNLKCLVTCCVAIKHRPQVTAGIYQTSAGPESLRHQRVAQAGTVSGKVVNTVSRGVSPTFRTKISLPAPPLMWSAPTPPSSRSLPRKPKWSVPCSTRPVRSELKVNIASSSLAKRRDKAGADQRKCPH